MMQRKIKILQGNRSYTFQDYFELDYSSRDVLADLGYEHVLKPLALPRADIGSFADLQSRMVQILPKVSLVSERARREFYISPLIWGLLDRLDFRLSMEYPLEVNDYLSGSLDYLLRATQMMIVTSARDADMDRGFTQLAAQLIAANEWFEPDSTQLYGAVTTGDLWQFGVLDVPKKVVYGDVNKFFILQHIDEIAAIFAGILSSEQALLTF